MEEIIVYVLTHKKFSGEYDNELYKPLLNGSCFINEELDYIRDDTGDNISKLNPYYRRWFVRNLKFDKLTKKDIINDLKNNDIILPQKTRLTKSLKETIVNGLKENPNYGAKWEDYVKLREVIKTNYPEYFKSFEYTINNKTCYNNNMFICNFELADEYFTWLFEVLSMTEKEIDFSTYPEDNKRVLGFFSEILLTVFVRKHDLKVKEHYLFLSARKMPLIQPLIRRFPKISAFEGIIAKIIK